ncbi:ComEC/Rec2 family competence protein [Cellulomonas cellasea]|uniref:ComEC/Rec2 family competence protein n=1 Tax=Cellulomonas cellasea TaxID=43670 RepID=UPI0025A3A1B4|nr:ComEC/Rec2 family competence protein [Cellulomonas cellasea]MDM8086576.1 ComEC/Rec2 family competence protein [Cellulomonas cellasea]
MGPPLDLRLVPAAAGAWVAAVLVVVLPPRAATLAAVAVACAVVAVVLVAWRAHRAPDEARVGRLLRERVGQVVFVGVVVVAVCGATAAQLHARAAGGLAAHAVDRAVVRVEGTLRTAPAAMPSAWPGGEPRFRTVLQLGTVEVRGVRSDIAAQVVVLGGSAWEGLRTGAAVIASGRLLPAEPGAREVAVVVVSGEPTVVADPPAVWRATGQLRAGLRALAARLPGDAGALLPGMAVGDTSRLPDDLAAAMRTSGLTHLTAVSGAHFALVGAAALTCATLLGLARPVRAVATAVVLVGFVVLVEPSPSVLRAAAMGAIGLGGLVAGRPARAAPALGAAVILLLIADPWLARDVGFVLSVLATAALVLLAGPLAARWSRTGRTTAAHALAAPVAAQSVCAPVLLLLTPSISAYAVVANLLVAPAVAPATVVGLMAALLAPAWPQGALVLAQVAGAGCWWVGAVARAAAGLPGARVAWVGGAVGAALLGLATVAAFALLLGPREAGAGPVHTLAREPAAGLARGSSVAGWGRASHTTLVESDRPWRRTRHPCRDLLGRGAARARGARRRG